MRDVTASNAAVAGGAGVMISTFGDLRTKRLSTGTLLRATPELS